MVPLWPTAPRVALRNQSEGARPLSLQSSEEEAEHPEGCVRACDSVRARKVSAWTKSGRKTKPCTQKVLHNRRVNTSSSCLRNSAGLAAPPPKLRLLFLACNTLQGLTVYLSELRSTTEAAGPPSVPPTGLLVPDSAFVLTESPLSPSHHALSNHPVWYLNLQ